MKNNTVQPEKVVKYIYIGVGLIGSFFAYKQIKKVVAEIKLKQKKNLLDTSVNTQSGVVDLGGIAAEIYDSFYNNDWAGVTEDEARAMALLLSVPTEYVSDLATVYFKTFQKILKADFVNYLSPEDYSSIKFKFS